MGQFSTDGNQSLEGKTDDFTYEKEVPGSKCRKCGSVGIIFRQHSDGSGVTWVCTNVDCLVRWDTTAEGLYYAAWEGSPLITPESNPEHFLKMVVVCPVCGENGKLKLPRNIWDKKLGTLDWICPNNHPLNTYLDGSYYSNWGKKEK